ncbi:MAG: hypothetical protein HWD84_10475 [Flavobacteriaceae bacterium]|nr:hypothetical protein [Flavobacteriaceae bacterium]
MTNRINLEATILSMSMEGHFSSAFDILKKENFTQTKNNPHKELWRVMCSLYPERHIDIITVSSKYSELYGINLSAYLVEINRLVTNDKITDYCLCLLEKDIRSKLITAIKLEESKLFKEGYLDMSSRYLELANFIGDLDTDLFKQLESIQSYLDILHHGKTPTSILRIFQALPKRIFEIKNKTGLASLSFHLLRRIKSSNSPELSNDASVLLTKLNGLRHG